MIRSMHLVEGQELRTELSPDEFREVIANGEGLLWVDIQNEPRETVEPLLKEVFGFHPLAIDDAACKLMQRHNAADPWRGTYGGEA